MKKILYPLFSAILIAMLVVAPAGAGGVRITFSLKSLFADISAWGLPSSTDYTFTLTASGVASVLCTNNGGNQAPGQNYPHVDGTDSKEIKPSKDFLKGGKVITSLEAIPELEANPVISWSDGGCANSNWSALVDFIYWQTAAVTITEKATDETTTYLYDCVTTRTGPAGDPASTFDDGTVQCTRTN